MATRRKGGFDLDRSIELTTTTPVDARQLVRTKEELLDPESFVHGFNGMITACRDEQKLYMLIDKNNPTLEASWKEIGGSIAGYDDTEVRALIAALQSGKANVADLSSVAISGDYNDLVNRPVLPAAYDDSALSGRVSALENAGFLTEHQDISGKANTADLATVATSGSYNDLSNKPTIPPAVTVDAAMSDTSENPVQNKVVLSAIGDAIDVVETAIADRYTKAETDAKIAEAMVDVDNEHFHPVTALPDPADARDNHEYVLITYAQDGTTIESETHYLFYDGVFHEKQMQVSLDGYATETYVNTATDALDTRVTALENAPATIPTLQQIYDEANGRPSIQQQRETENLRTISTTRLLGSQIEITSSYTDKVTDITTSAQTQVHPGMYTTFSGDEELRLRPDQFYIGTVNEPQGVPAFQIDFKVEGEKNVIVSDDLKAPFRAALGIDTIDTRVTAIETALNLTALTDEEIAALVPA